MREDYLQAALKVIDDPNILVNVVSLRVKQLKRGNRALVNSLEKLLPEDTALREIAEGKITFELATAAELAALRPSDWRPSVVGNVRSPESASVQAFKGASLPRRSRNLLCETSPPNRILSRRVRPVGGICLIHRPKN